MSFNQTKFTVAICGGGIGGLTLALALARHPNIECHVYEAAERFEEIGAGIMIWGRSWKIMQLLGLDRALRQIAQDQVIDGKEPTFGFDFRKSDQAEEGFSFCPLSLPHTLYVFHRAHFMDVLVDRLPHHIGHFGKRLVSYNRESLTGPINLNFADNTTAVCDVLIGCDGVKSAVRATMLKEIAATGHPELLKHIEPRWSGWIAYRALVPVEKLTNKDGKKHVVFEKPMMYCGLHKHVVSYGIAGGKIANIVGMYAQPVGEDATYDGPWMSEATGDEVSRCYDGWEPEVLELLWPIDKALKWVLPELRALPTYIHGHVALLGDSAHAMTPHQGAGAGQAIEDAFVLSGILGHPSTTRETLSRALEAYDHVRVPFANHVLHGSRSSGKMYEFWHDIGADYDALRPAIAHQWDWVDTESPDQQLERAIRWMQGDKE